MNPDLHSKQAIGSQLPVLHTSSGWAKHFTEKLDHKKFLTNPNWFIICICDWSQEHFMFSYILLPRLLQMFFFCSHCWSDDTHLFLLPAIWFSQPPRESAVVITDRKQTQHLVLSPSTRWEDSGQRRNAFSLWASTMDLSLPLCSMIRFTKRLEQYHVEYSGNKVTQRALALMFLVKLTT